jgi:dTDP-glucose pyrophosphorylase/dTDP-4-dehydrorhamnose 3,5-epimerase-like enzyme
MKGVILAGGTGSRLEPLTRVTNKHLLPIGEKPMVEWASDALEEAGVRDLLLVTGSDHVDDFRRYFGNNVRYAQQERAGGIAEALGLARDFVGDERFVVMLADNVYGGSIAPTIHNFERQERGARVLLAHVRETEHLRHLGVPRIENDRIVEIEEKPRTPPGRLAVTGLYCYEPEVFEIVANLQPSDRGELEITDVNNHFALEGTLEYYEVIDRFRRARDPYFRGDRMETIPLRRFDDERGWFAEVARLEGMPRQPLQTNVSFSRQGTIRGLHFHERGQDDLFICLQGRARVVALDRETGETFCEDVGDGKFAAVYVPGNLAHGFEALTDVLMLYHVTEVYDEEDPDEHQVPWDDPRVVDLWSTRSPILSERDRSS